MIRIDPFNEMWEKKIVKNQSRKKPISKITFFYSAGGRGVDYQETYSDGTSSIRQPIPRAMSPLTEEESIRIFLQNLCKEKAEDLGVRTGKLLIEITPGKKGITGRMGPWKATGTLRH